MAGRTWLAVALCCLVWFVYMRWFAPPPVPQVQDATHQTTTATTPGATTPVATGGTGLFAAPMGTVSHTAKTPALEIGFSDDGGKIVEVGVIGYNETVDPKSGLVRPLMPGVTDAALTSIFTDAALKDFAHGKYERVLSDQGVEYRKAVGGVEFSKFYRFDQNQKYRIGVEYRLKFPKGAKRDWGHLILPVGATNLTYNAEQPLKHWEVVRFQNEKVERKTVDSLGAEEIFQGLTGWLSFGNRYFVTTQVVASEMNPDVGIGKFGDFQGGFLRYPLVLKPDQELLDIRQQLFIGPKDYQELTQVTGLRRLIDYGMFSWLAFPLLEILRFFYKFVHNYGIAIILLTILVRLLFYPLSLKSYKSMKAMQRLQPEIAALKERYKDDMQRFNQEQMQLFKTHKVNPMGGCLPMLVQLPVFIALYAVLGNSIELFHAPFFGWIHDLSAMDPYYVFPVLMGISMFVQQRMTPTPGMDPVQVKIMYLMPVIFTFVMLKLPSGLTIYIFLSTLLGIVQQTLMNRDPQKKAVALTAKPSN